MKGKVIKTEPEQWLLGERAQLLGHYEQLDFRLATGHIHGDAYPGNMLWDGQRVLLGDWDGVAIGPRELDLANTYQGVRFGRTNQQLAEFAETYGFDFASWSGASALTAIRTLGLFVRRADCGDDEAARHLRHRLMTLRSQDHQASWMLI